TGAVVAPMTPSAFINPAVIHRTACLIAAGEGRPPQPFRYREGMALEGGAPGVSLFDAGAMTAARWTRLKAVLGA
ncbi:MAG: hypothetical protein WCQ64_10085, partial [Acidobacteriota bacterium]